MLTDEKGLIERQIVDWVRRNVCLVDRENGRCNKIVLRQLSVDNKPVADVHTANLPGDPAVEGTEISDRVILEISDAAQRDADDVGGIQKYAIYAYYLGNKNYVPRKIFRVAAQEEVEREREGTSEPATEKGLMSQLMRHNEVNMKNSMVSMGYILNTFQREIQQQRDQNKIFLNQQVEMTLLVQEVLDNSSKRRIEEKRAEMQSSMLEGVFEHLKIGLPILFNRLAGRDVFPAKMERELYMMASLFEGLSQEQQAEISNMLRPEQLSLLAEILGMYEERKHKYLKKHGEETEPEETGKGGSEKPASKNVQNIGTGTNKLLQLFEKRSHLVNGEKAIEVEDDRAKRIEKRALDIRNKLKEVGSVIRGDDKKNQ